MPIEVKLLVNRRSSDRVRVKLRELIKKVHNPRSANRQVSVWLLRWVNENFRTDGGNVGGWEPFKYGGRVVTKKSGKGDSQSISGRRYVNAQAKLLEDSGDLRASFEGFFSKDSAGVGSDIPYSAGHELGIPLSNLPSRRLLPTKDDKDVSDKIIKIYDAYIKKLKDSSE